MPIALLTQLLITFGPSAVALIDKLIAIWTTTGTVSAQQWADLRTAALQTAKDRMLLQLQAAGIDPNSPQGVALLAAAS